MQKLEKALGHLAIPGVVRYIVILQGGFILLGLMAPQLNQFMVLDPDLVMRGEVWRLLTFLFMPGDLPPGTWVIFAFCGLMLLWTMGDGLEEAMGSVRLNLFILFGILCSIATAFFILGGPLAYGYVMTSILFAFATYYPDFRIMLFFIIPVRIKWIAILTGAILLLSLLTGSWSTRLGILVGFLNYFVFFGSFLLGLIRMQRVTSAQKKRYFQFKAATRSLNDDGFHKCLVCGRTDSSHPELEFRVSSKDGQEYCVDHVSMAPYQGAEKTGP